VLTWNITQYNAIYVYANDLYLRPALFLFVTSLLKLNARIACSICSDEGSCCSQAFIVLVEQNIPFVFNELALAEYSINFCPSARTTLKVDTRGSEALLQGGRSIPPTRHSSVNVIALIIRNPYAL